MPFELHNFALTYVISIIHLSLKIASIQIDLSNYYELSRHSHYLLDILIYSGDAEIFFERHAKDSAIVQSQQIEFKFS